MADTGDLKSPALTGVRVRVPPSAQALQITVCKFFYPGMLHNLLKRGTAMSGKRISLGSRYKRFFLSERTVVIAAVMSIAILPVIWYFGTRSGGIDLADRYDLLMRLLLVATLFWSLKKHKLFLMQAATVGLLFCMLCAQSQYALGNLASRDSETYITMGLQGFIFLAGERMILFIQSFVCISHFIIHAARKQEAIRVSVNQVSILFLLALVIVQLMIAPVLAFDLAYVLYVWTLHLDELFIFILVACAELILMIDQREFEGA